MKRLILPILAMICGSRADADTNAVNSADRLQYPAAWYANFAPRTALDMVKQTPGFTLQEGEARRGLAGAMGNVLIDGRRPVIKDQSLAEILQRVPAPQVQRIEVLRGAAAAGDASGQAVLANVVRTAFSAQGFGSVGFEYAQQHEPMPNGTLVWSGRARSVDYALGATTYSFARELPGTRALSDADGDPDGTRRDASPRDYGEYALNGEVGRDIAGGRLRATGKASYSRYHEDSSVDSFDAGGAPTGSEFNPYTESRRGAELSAQFVRSLDAWDLESLLLLTRSRFEGDITSTSTAPSGDLNSVFTQLQAQDSGESVLRATLARDLAAGRRIEFGLEGARNTLDADLALTLDLGGGPFAIPVPNSNVRIEERRTDGYASFGWRPRERWSIDVRVAGEHSRLEFSGDTRQSVTFAFLKPAIEITRRLGAAHQLRLRVFRDVGQLDFTDFVSSVSLTDERVDGGNPDLRPQTEWSAELGVDLRVGNDVALSLGAFHRWVRDTADFTVVGPPEALVNAPGNIGDARVLGARLNTRLPVPQVRGAVLTADITWQRSRVTDPLTGESRPISELPEWNLSAGFRQDLARLAWGVNYREDSGSSRWLLSEIDRRKQSPSLDVFAEAPLPGALRLRAVVVSLLGQDETRARLFFDPDRRAGEFSAERRRYRPGRWFQLYVSRSF